MPEAAATQSRGDTGTNQSELFVYIRHVLFLVDLYHTPGASCNGLIELFLFSVPFPCTLFELGLVVRLTCYISHYYDLRRLLL